MKKIRSLCNTVTRIFDEDRYMTQIKENISTSKFIAFVLILFDIISIGASYFGALMLRFDFSYSKIDEQYIHMYKQSILVYVCVCVFIYVLFHLYSSIWEYASTYELRNVICAVAISLLAYVVGMHFTLGRMPISYYVFGVVLQGTCALAARFGYRFMRSLHRINLKNEAQIKHVMIVGAGASGQMLLHDLMKSEHRQEKVCCLLDDDKNKWGRYIDGVKILGGRSLIAKAVEDYHIDKIYVCMASASAAQRKEILNLCAETGCELKNLPAMYQLAKGEVTVSSMKEVKVEDLLGREQIKVNMDEIFYALSGQTVMVTGGGGSIGSELCRQIAAHDPGRLIIFEVYENNAYDIQQELKKKYPDLKLDVIIGSVRDSRKIWQVCKTYRPDYIYHAAAHKHVPLMEDSPCEAIKNNAIGTYKTAYAAMVHGCKRFVLISTDKAVNPTNIMGASKRLCEMVVQAFDAKIKEGKADEIPQLFTHFMLKDLTSEATKLALQKAKTEFVAVRFGNVLGSNGSVIPLFKKQIAAGGPVTVTHPDIIRYFMTIPEAVSLVLEAGTYAHGGEIFVLDMGEPVKIDTLARNLIRLSGHKPDEDIKIIYTGLRPGEKLYEEKLMSEEGMKKTENDLIHIGSPIPFRVETFLEQLNGLMDAAYKNDKNIREKVQAVVNTYHPAENG